VELSFFAISLFPPQEKKIKENKEIATTCRSFLVMHSPYYLGLKYKS
jgi:hypothetical protein